MGKGRTKERARERAESISLKSTSTTNSSWSIRWRELRSQGAQLDWRVERTKLSKDKRSLIYNDFLTLSGIPPEVFEYRLGNRSALDWLIDQYQVSTDKRSSITNDPNRSDDPQYIMRLVRQVVTVSSKTAKLVDSLSVLQTKSDK